MLEHCVLGESDFFSKKKKKGGERVNGDMNGECKCDRGETMRRERVREKGSLNENHCRKTRTTRTNVQTTVACLAVAKQDEATKVVDDSHRIAGQVADLGAFQDPQPAEEGCLTKLLRVKRALKSSRPTFTEKLTDRKMGSSSILTETLTDSTFKIHQKEKLTHVQRSPKNGLTEVLTWVPDSPKTDMGTTPDRFYA